MKRILVTGGAGFLGSHLCARLTRDGHQVLCLDDFSTGAMRNIEHIGRWFSYQHHDIRQPFGAFGEHAKPHEIYNLACPASPRAYQADPIKTTETCVLGALNVLRLAQKTGAKVLQASTSEVYGDPTVHPQKETYWGNVNPIGPRACYDEGKRCAESLFMDFHRQHGTRIKIARIFNTYGPRMAVDDGRVVSNFIVQALRGEPLTVYGDGNQTRAFCYVDDTIDGLIRLMESDDAVTGPVNLGTPLAITMTELTRWIIQFAGSSSEVAFRPLPQDDPTQRCPDIQLAYNVLGWWVSTYFGDGLSRTIDYFRDTLNIEANHVRHSQRPATERFGDGPGDRSAASASH